MSTFNGIVHEFPCIRIDFFRIHSFLKPPSACFLSHIHSDHLQGLESLRMPFVYCSAATRKLLLRMEKYPHRINFQKGILESRKQTYKHLSKILRPLPLLTPIELEVDPKLTIRVTLFDANHCPGAVMFLIEGDGKAILYTGDIRAEAWWVNSIVRNPIILPYASGKRRLDCIYLDTTFASRHNIYDEFPSKVQGLKELLGKLEQCPRNSIFYFRAWTLGYEDVWIAITSFLKAKVHVDDYQLRLFTSLAEDKLDQGPALAGCSVGNQIQSGCLTTDLQTAIHSCEPGMECHLRLSKKPNLVWITPIISRLSDGTEIAEIGAGGGRGDLYQVPELELTEEAAIQALDVFCISNIKDKSTLARVQEALRISMKQDTFKMSLEGLGLDLDQEVTLKEFVNFLSTRNQPAEIPVDEMSSQLLDQHSKKSQKVIHFPYSRHSSFSELRHLISSFRPKDICPCTVELSTWTDEVSMQSLFGDLCSEKTFLHDQETRSNVEAHKHQGDGEHAGVARKRKRDEEDVSSQETASQDSESENVYRSAQMTVHQASGPPTTNDTTCSKDNINSMKYVEEKRTHTISVADDDTEPNPKSSHESISNNKISPPDMVKQLQRAINVSSSGPSDLQEHQPSDPNTRHALNKQNLTNTMSPIHPEQIQQDKSYQSDHRSNTTLSDDAFTTKTTTRPQNEVPQHDGANDDKNTDHPPQPTHLQPTDSNAAAATYTDSKRIEARKAAYRSAKKCLQDNDFDEWNGLRLRSMGWKGHTEEEVIL